MAIYHFSAKIISRGRGQSAIAAAAYRSGDPLFDERTGELKAYELRSLRIIHKEILAPRDAPEWARDRNALWNAAERAEKRKDAQLAREIEVSLPHELTEQQRLFLVKDFAREQFVRRGYVVDLAIHMPDRGDARNHHAHLMITRRTMGSEGFAPTKDWQFDPQQLAGWREQWANLANRHLKRHGHDAQIDHRSLEAQGIDREATTHVGYAGKEMAARGAQSDRMDELTGIVDRNAIRASIKVTEGELAQLRELAANENRQRRTEPARSHETRSMTDLPTDDELKKQPEREVDYLKHMEFRQVQARAVLDRQRQAHELEQRVTSFQQAKEIEAEEARRKQAAQETAESGRDARNGDITDASTRYGIAVGQHYDVRDPYASLARTAGAESAAFLRTQQELKEAAAKEADPDKRKVIELRRQIEGCDYMAITSERLAGISTAVTGRSDNPHAVADRQKAADYRGMATALREERGALLEAIQAKEGAVRDRQAHATASQATSRPDRASAPRRAAHAAPQPYLPVHPTLPRSASAPTAAPVTAPERSAQPDQAPAPRHDSQPGPEPYAPVHPTLPRSSAVPDRPASYAPVHPTLPRSAVAPKAAPAPATERTARPDQARGPEHEPRSERASATPIPEQGPASRAAQPTAAQPMIPREPARLEPQPFAALSLKPSYAVTMPKPAAPSHVAPVKDAAIPEAAPPSVARTAAPDMPRTATRTHYRSELPTAAPEPQALSPQAAETGKEDKGDKGKGERTGEAGAMPAPRRGDYRSLPSEIPEPRVVDRDGRDAGTLSEFMKTRAAAHERAAAAGIDRRACPKQRAAR